MTGPLFTEQRLTLPQAARELNINPATVWRWCTIGCRGQKLEFLQIGSKKIVTREALERFVGRLTAAAKGEKPTPKPASKTRNAAAKEGLRRKHGLASSAA